MRVWFLTVGFGRLTGWVTMLLMELLTLVNGGLATLSLMLVAICPGFVVAGTLSFLTFIGFFIAISRAVVNHDGRDGTAPDPLVWSAGALPKRRRLVHAVRDQAFLPGTWYLGFGMGHVHASAIYAEDIAHWPYTLGLLVEWVAFLGSLHWPVGGVDLCVGGISYVDFLILYELWAGERLSLEKVLPRYLRPGRPISASAVPFGPGIDIWRSCRFVGAINDEVSLLAAWWAWEVCALLCWC